MMNKIGPLRYFQILYCLCHTSPPTPDFLPFVLSHLKGFTRGNQNGLSSLKAEEDFEKEEHEQVRIDECRRIAATTMSKSRNHPPSKKVLFHPNFTPNHPEATILKLMQPFGDSLCSSQRLAKLREKKEFDDKEADIWKDRPSWYTQETGTEKKSFPVAPPPMVLTDAYKVNIGKGIIAQYANCCIDMIHRVVKLGKQGKSPPVRINEDHIKHLQRRAPLLTKVSLDFVGEDEGESSRKGSKPNMFQQVRFDW